MIANPNIVPQKTDRGQILQGAVVVLGRLFFTLIFLTSAPGLFSKDGIAYAAAQGVPLASVAVPLSGVMAVVGGLSILLGYRARIGACLVALFLVAVTPSMHKFWGVADPAQAQEQMISFTKNLSILGGALLIAHFGAGPLSLDSRRTS